MKIYQTQKNNDQTFEHVILKLIINKKYPLNLNQLSIAKKNKIPSLRMALEKNIEKNQFTHISKNSMLSQGQQDLTMGQFFAEKVKKRHLLTQDNTRDQIRRYLWRNQKLMINDKKDKLKLSSKDTQNLKKESHLLRSISQQIVLKLGTIKNKFKQQNQQFKKRQLIQFQNDNENQNMNCFDLSHPSIRLKSRYPIQKSKTQNNQDFPQNQQQFLNKINKTNMYHNFKKFKFSINHKKMLKIR